MLANIIHLIGLTILVIGVNGDTSSWISSISYTWKSAQHAGAQAGNALHKGAQ